jgi:hypothetical protein
MTMARRNPAGKQSGKDKAKNLGRTYIGVSVDTVLWRQLRALAITKGKVTGELLDAAIQDYLERHEK